MSTSSIFPYIDKIILYGSSARGEENWSSDVDIFLILNDETPRVAIRALHELKGTFLDAPFDEKLARVDLHSTFISTWENKNQDFFFCQIKKDGIILWEK